MLFNVILLEKFDISSARYLFGGWVSSVSRGTVETPFFGHRREQQRHPEEHVQLHRDLRRSRDTQVRLIDYETRKIR